MNLSAALFQRAENSNKPNQNASAARRDQCMNRSLSTQSAFTTKLNVRKGPGLLGTAVDHALSLSLVFARRAHCRLRLGQYTALQVNGVLQSDPYMPAREIGLCHHPGASVAACCEESDSAAGPRF